jgi:hypothetical protein
MAHVVTDLDTSARRPRGLEGLILSAFLAVAGNEMYGKPLSETLRRVENADRPTSIPVAAS